MRGDLRQQMVADDQDFFLAQIDHAMTGRMAGRPDDFESPIAYGIMSPSVKNLSGCGNGIVHIGAHPGRAHTFDRVFLDREAVAIKNVRASGCIAGTAPWSASD